MLEKLSLWLDDASEFLAHRKGLLPIIGLVLVIANFVLQVFPAGWLTQTNCLLHLGLVIVIIGFMLARAL